MNLLNNSNQLNALDLRKISSLKEIESHQDVFEKDIIQLNIYLGDENLEEKIGMLNNILQDVNLIILNTDVDQHKTERSSQLYSQSPNEHYLLLTKREQEIIQCMSRGSLYKEIADQLYISTETVKKHVSNIYKKLKVNNRVEALNKVLSIM